MATPIQKTERKKFATVTRKLSLLTTAQVHQSNFTQMLTSQTVDSYPTLVLVELKTLDSKRVKHNGTQERIKMWLQTWR